MGAYADDLAKLVEALDPKDAVHVGHSTGGGEVARYIGHHDTKRVAKVVLVATIRAPSPLTSESTSCRASSSVMQYGHSVLGRS